MKYEDMVEQYLLLVLEELTELRYEHTEFSYLRMILMVVGLFYNEVIHNYNKLVHPPTSVAKILGTLQCINKDIWLSL